MGEVVFYVSGSEGSHYQCSQTVRCGGSAITCTAWLSNSRCVYTPLIAAYPCIQLNGCPTQIYS